MTANSYFESKFPKLNDFHKTIKDMEAEHKMSIQEYISYEDANGMLHIVINEKLPKEIRETVQNRFTVIMHR
jgi:hypothetical protein